jgi:glycosyltransferase involved in cell wall biosynthesis
MIERYACIHAVEEAAFPAALLARRYRIPLLYDMQSSLPEQLAQRWPFALRPVRALLERAERWLLRRATLVVTSAGLAARVRRLEPDALVREWHFPSGDTAVSREAVERLRQELALPLGAPVVLYSGTFEPYQGLAELVAAVPKVRAEVPGAVFVLVGADKVNGLAAHSAAEPLMQSGALRIVDRQPRSAMAAYLSLATVLVSPRAYGGNLPLKIFDYLAAGRPIVATDIPTHRTVLADDRAVLVPPTTGALAAGILSVLRDETRAAQLAGAARSYAKTHLSWPRFVDSIGAIYGELERHAPVAR